MHPTGTFVPDFAIHSHLQQLSRKQFSSPYVSTEVHVVGSPIFPLQHQTLLQIGSGVKDRKEEAKAIPTRAFFLLN